MGQTTKRPGDSRFRDHSAPGRLIGLMSATNARVLAPARNLARRTYQRISSPLFARAIAAYDRGAHDAALRLFRRLAERGHAGAQYHLGLMYSAGQGTARDDVKAMYWFAKAAEQGDPKARFIHALRV